MDSLDKNATISENRNYYYNLKDYTFRRGSIEDVMTNCNKMIAIATNNLHGNDDSGLYDRVFKDVSDIITKKKRTSLKFKIKIINKKTMFNQ